jgi:hypothetical protein
MVVTELRTKWIEALRSDEYSQGQGNLKVANCGPDEAADFCCLGVLCDLVDSNRWTEKSEGYFTFEGHSDFPPQEILDLVDLTKTQAQELATFNDDDGYRFEDIANFLESGTRLIDHDDCEPDEDGNYDCEYCAS